MTDISKIREKLMAESGGRLFSFSNAFISLPQVISFFSEKMETLFGKKSEKLQIKEGKNIFSETKKINSWLRQQINYEKTLGRYLIKVPEFNKVQFYNLNTKKGCDMSWETFFVELPKALAKMKKRYEEIVGELTREISEEAEEVTKETSRRNAIPEAVRIAVWRRDEGKCAKCGGRKSLEYDHIIPVSKGGGNTVRNIELLCEECNRKKRDNIE